MNMKKWASEYVRTSRKHEDLKIEHYVVYDAEGIRIEMSLEDFLLALATEMHDPVVTVTRGEVFKQLLRRKIETKDTVTKDALLPKLLAASKRVIADMKNSTIDRPPMRKEYK